MAQTWVTGEALATLVRTALWMKECIRNAVPTNMETLPDPQGWHCPQAVGEGVLRCCSLALASYMPVP